MRADLARWTKVTIHNESLLLLLLLFLWTLKYINFWIYLLEKAVNCLQHSIFVIFEFEGNTIWMDQKKRKNRQEIRIHLNIENRKLEIIWKKPIRLLAMILSATFLQCYRTYFRDVKLSPCNGLLQIHYLIYSFPQKYHSKANCNEKVAKKWN